MPPQKKKGTKSKQAREAKPPKEELLRHQAVKELLRSAKLIKTLLTRKCVRKCKTLKEDPANEKKYAVAQEQLQLLKDLSQDILQPIAHDLVYGDEDNPLLDLKNWSTLKTLSNEVQPVVKDILKQKSFLDVFNEQTEKITKAKIPYKSKRQRQIEESAQRKEAEGGTCRQRHKQNVGVFIESLEDATVTDVMPVVRRDRDRDGGLMKNKGTKGVPRHLRESHVEERKRQRQPDLSAYGPPPSAGQEDAPKVSHGNRVVYGESHNNKKFKSEDTNKKAVSNDEWKKAGMHPSWVAKQKQKSESATIGAISLSTNSGNKITFSDD